MLGATRHCVNLLPSCLRIGTAAGLGHGPVNGRGGGRGAPAAAGRRGMAAARPPLPVPADFAASHLIETRVQDTDLQGHINNVHFYSFMDSGINGWAMAAGDDFATAPRYVVENGLSYHHPGVYPSVIDVRFGVRHLGSSSVEYHCGMFDQASEVLLASGKFVHVFVSIEPPHRPVDIPGHVRSILESIRL